MGNHLTSNLSKEHLVEKTKQFFTNGPNTFFKNVEYIQPEELQRCSEKLSNTKLDRIKTYNKIDGEIVCGLNAFRLALKLHGVEDSHFPEFSDFYPFCDKTFFIDHGPKPQEYCKFIANWSKIYDEFDVNYKYGRKNLQELNRHDWLRESLLNDHPVICLGSMGFNAHYFVVVGIESKDGNLEYVYALSNEGGLLRMQGSYFLSFTDVKILTVPNITLITII